MTISLKSDASGNSGTLQVAGVDRLTLNTDGSLVAGANPATGTRSMALATMQKFADEFGASLAANGYQKLPSGLIIQWGRYITTANTSQSITLPIAFPSAKFTHTVTKANGSIGVNVAVEPAYTFTDLGSIPLSLSSASAGIGVNFIAIGY